MIKVKFPFVFFLFSLPAIMNNLSYSQVLNLGYQKTIGGGNSDIPSRTLMTSDGGYIITGTSNSGISGEKTESSRGGNDYWVIKFDNSHNIEWQKTLGGSLTDNSAAVAETPNGDFLVFGSSSSPVSGDKTAVDNGGGDYWLVKISINGAILWDKSFGGTSSEVGNSIYVNNNGEIYLGGSSGSNIFGDKSENSRGGNDYWILKLDSLGNKIWDKTIGGALNENFRDFIILPNGEIVIYGTSPSNISGEKSQNSYNNSNDIWMVKLNSTGTLLWDLTLGGDDTESPGYSIIFNNGFYYITCPSLSGISGVKTEASRGQFDIWIVKVNDNGILIWDKTIGGSGSDSGLSLFITSNNQLLVSGGSDSNISGDKTENSNGSNDAWIVALDISGVLLWQKTIGGSQSDVILCSHEIAPGYYLLTCYSSSNISGDKAENSRGLEDFWFVELQTDLSTGEIFLESEFQVFPNPAKNLIYINFEKIVNSELIKIFDFSGKLVYSEIPRKTMPIDISKYSSGFYFISYQGNIKSFVVTE